MSFKNGFKMYTPDSASMLDIHNSLSTLPQSYHFRAIIKNNQDLFIADSANILTIMMAEYEFKYTTMTSRQTQTLIAGSLSEYTSMMESKLMGDIEEYASAMSGRGQGHLFTLDLIDSAIRDYEEWINYRYSHSDKPVHYLLLEKIFEKHMQHNVPSIIHNVIKRVKDDVFPDLNINTHDRKGMVYSVTW